MKKLFAMVAFVAAAMSASAQEEVTPRSPIVPWGAQAEIIITNDLTQKNSDGSWQLNADAMKWIEYSYDGTTENGTIQQTNRPNVWFDFYNETTDTMIVTSAELNWGGYLTVSSKTGSTEGLMIVGKNRYPAFYVTGTDKAKFYFSGSAGTAGYPQIEVYEVGGETPVATYTGDYALTKKTWDHSTLLIADGLDKAKSYKIVARTMNKVDDTTFGYEGGDIVLQVLKFYGDQAPMREDGTIISGSELGSYINQHLAAYPEVRAFSLEGSGKYTITEGIVSDSTLTITGVAKAPATIDASALAAPFIKFNNGKTKLMKPAPVVDPETGDSTYVESSFYDVPEVTIANVKITGLAQSLINDAQKSLFGKIDIINDNIELAGSSAVFGINGFPTKLTINKSTLWSAEGHKGFLFQVQGRPMKDYDADATTTFSIENSTLFQIGVGKKINNNNSGIKGQTCLHLNLSKSVLVNTGSSVGGEITGWLFGQNSTNPTVTYDQNTYWNLGTKEVTNEETGEVTTENVSEVVPGWTGDKAPSDTTQTQLTTAPFVLDKAIAGNFTVGANSQQAKYMTGDPRWLVPYATDAIKIEVDQSENTDFAAVLNEALQLSEQPSSITIQFFEAGEYPLTQEINTTAPITIQNGSDIDAGEATIVVNNGMVLGGAIKIDGVNLKAGEELAAPVITLQANEYMKLDNGYFNLSKIQLLNLKVTGLKNHLICSTKKLMIPEIETKNCEIYMAGKISGSGNTPAIYDFRQGGVPVTWNFVKSTLDANDNCIYSTAGGDKAGNVEGVTMQTLNVSEATIVNPVKKAFQHRQNNQKWLRYILKSSIIMVNKDKPNFVAEMNAGGIGGNPTWQIDKNSFMQVNTETNEETGEVTTTIVDVSSKQGTGDNDEPVTNSLTGVTTFADQANYDFTIEASSEQASKKVGDPRWLVDFVSPFSEFYGIVGDLTGGWDDDLEMTMTKWGIFEATVEAFNVTEVKGYEYKLRDNKDWDGYKLPDEGNNTWTPDTTGIFNLTFVADVLNHTLTVKAEPTVYTVAGSYNGEASFFGEAWSAELAANDMTRGEDGVYTLTFQGVELENAGTILYKVVQNHKWDKNWGFVGSEENPDGNADYVINEPGTYDITFFFNPVALLENNFNVHCVAVKQALKGDVNNDGQVGIGDIVAITNVMAGIFTDMSEEEIEILKAAADVNGDGQVGIGDIVAITNIMAGTNEEVPEEQPAE